MECWRVGGLEGWRVGGLALCELHLRLRAGNAETHSSARSVIFIAIVSENEASSDRSDI